MAEWLQHFKIVPVLKLDIQLQDRIYMLLNQKKCNFYLEWLV